MMAPYHGRVPNDVVESLEVGARDRSSRLLRRGSRRGDDGVISRILIGLESKVI